MSRAVMQQALDALEKGETKLRWAAISALKQALAEPEQEPQTTHWEGCEAVHPECKKQEPVAWMKVENFIDAEGLWDERVTFNHDGDGKPLYTAPTPQREHSTDGSPCWCNPDVIEEDGGNVIVHNYEDNWQQYAKPGETAQQCIERHRAEQDALMKLYATPRKTDLEALNAELVEALKHAAECVQSNYLPDKCGHDWDDVIQRAEASNGS